MLDIGAAEDVLASLAKYQCTSCPHVTVSLMWRMMMRVSNVYTLNVDY
jgi:hypothetical protein